jgi:hypothetical protein
MSAAPEKECARAGGGARRSYTRRALETTAIREISSVTRRQFRRESSSRSWSLQLVARTSETLAHRVGAPPRAPLATSRLPRALVPMVDAPPAESADAPDAASPDDPAPPAIARLAVRTAKTARRGAGRIVPRKAQLESAASRAGASEAEILAMIPRVEGTYASDPARHRAPPPPFAPRSFAPPIRPVASRRFLSPMDRSNLTRFSAILSDHPTRRLSPPSASNVTHPPRPPHPLRHPQTTRVSPPSPRAPASSPASSPPTRPPGTPSSSPTTTADASRASTGATRRSAAPRSTASGRTNRR